MGRNSVIRFLAPLVVPQMRAPSLIPIAGPGIEQSKIAVVELVMRENVEQIIEGETIEQAAAEIHSERCPPCREGEHEIEAGLPARETDVCSGLTVMQPMLAPVQCRMMEGPSVNTVFDKRHDQHAERECARRGPRQTPEIG